MPLPGNVSTGTVVGRFMDSAGQPVTGTVTFTPSPRAIKNITASPSPTFILPQPVTATLDVNGTISVTLIATDDADNNPVNWTYAASFAFGSGLSADTFSFALPSDTTVNLAVVAPAASSNGAAIIARGVPTGGAVGQVLVKASTSDYDLSWSDPSSALIPTASTTVQGKVELATNAETTAGTDTARATTPAGVKAAINVEAALARNGDNITSGTIAAARIDTAIARDAEVSAAVAAHVDDTTAAHAASAIGFTPTGTISATNVQDAIVEAVSEAGAGAGPVAADDVSFTPTGTIAATNVQTAIEEVAAEASAYDTHRVYTGPGASAGYDTLIDLDYDATSGTIPESVMIRAQNTSDVLTKAFWINEAGQPRVWTVAKDEPALKLFAFGDNGAGKVLTVQDRWDSSELRWGINGKGQVVLGDAETIGGSVVVLDMADPVPLDLPEATLVVRRGAGGSENLLSNPSFDTSVTGWAHASDGLTYQSGTGSDGEAGFARMTASGTGNRNIQATSIPAVAGDVLSVEVDVRWNAGATPKAMSVMIRYLDAGGSQLANNVGTSVTPGTGAWSTISSLNATAPALTASAQIQIRMNSAATSDAVDIDDGWVNVGPVIDRTSPDPGTISVWNGASEVLINDGSGAGGSGDFATNADLDGAIASLAPVASSGAYVDLTGTPVLPLCKNVAKTSAQDFTTTTFANDSNLVLTLPVGTFDIELMVAYDATTANDAKFQFTFSGTATCIMTAIYPRLAAAPSPATATHSIDNGTHALSMSTAFSNNFQNAGGGGAGVPMPMRIHGRVIVTAGGNLQLQVAKQANTDTGTATRTLAGSYLTAVELVTSP